MPTPNVIPISYSYKKPESDVWVLNTDDLPIEKERIRDMQIVHLAIGSVGGNHTHPRTEWFVAIGDLELVWLDEEGKQHFMDMNPGGKLQMIEMPPHIPHAVRNKSIVKGRVLFECADMKQKDVEYVKVI